jgi:O-antigen ligase
MTTALSVLVAGVAFGPVTSQFLLDVSTISIFLCLIYACFRPTAFSTAPFKRIGIEWALFGYFLVALLSLALSAPEPKPWFYSLRKFTWLFDFYLIIWATSQMTGSLKKWISFFCFAYILPNFYAFWTFYLGQDFFSQEFTRGRLTGLVHSATYHAHANGVILVFFGALGIGLWGFLSLRLKAFFLFSFAIMGVSVFLTYTRGIWISVPLSLLFFLTFLSWKHFLKGLLGLIIVFSALLRFIPMVQERMDNLIDGATGVGIRENLYRVFWLMFKDHPIIGIGYWDQYRQIKDYWPRLGLPADYFRSHAHNQYMNVLGTTGALGLFFFLSIIGYFLWTNFQLYRKAQDHVSKIFLLACLTAQVEFYLACVTDVTFEYAKIRALIILIWALLIAYKRGLLKPYFPVKGEDSSH